MKIWLCSYTVVGRSFFHPSLGIQGELGDGIDYWRGYYQSLRPTQMGLSLNIGIPHSYLCLFGMFHSKLHLYYIVSNMWLILLQMCQPEHSTNHFLWLTFLQNISVLICRGICLIRTFLRLFSTLYDVIVDE